MPTSGVSRVVVFVQENKTTDFYFSRMAEWGATVAVPASASDLLTAPPDHDQPHDRNAWVHYAMGDYPAVPLQVDTDIVIPWYSWLAKQFTFCDHHVGSGSNSTPGHMLAVGGQMPTMKNPPFTGTHPVWDLPTVFHAAAAGGASYGVFPDQDRYPSKFYAFLENGAGRQFVHAPGDFETMARAGTLPQVCYVWSPAGYDEHPPAKSDPTYVSKGETLVRQRVQAVVDGGGWEDTVFLLTWDDWGGYADSVPSPSAETLPDALHPDGFQAIGGSRIPLLLFGGRVRQGVETQWHSHASIPRTVIDLLGLPPMGVPRVDDAPSLASCVDATLSRPAPPAPGATVTQPPAPTPRPTPQPTRPWPGPLGVPMPALVTLDGSVVPAPTDGVVRPTPPKA